MTKAGLAVQTRIQRRQPLVKKKAKSKREARKYFTRPAQLMLRLEAEDKNVFYSMAAKRSIIGRSLMAPIFVDDDRVSREHAAIDIDRGHYYVVDLGSTNGTWVNSKRVKDPVKVHYGDTIRVGETVLYVDLKSEKPKLRVKSDVTNVMISKNATLARRKRIIVQEKLFKNFINFIKKHKKQWSKMTAEDVEMKKRQAMQWIGILLCLVVIIAAMFVSQ